MNAIATADLLLEPLYASHAAEMYALLADDRIWEFTGTRAPSDADALRADYLRREGRTSPDGRQRWLNWVVRRTSDGRPLGFVQATVTADEAQIAYVFGRAFWGNGYARTAVCAMLQALRQDAELKRFIAYVDARNERSIRLLEVCDFVLIDDRDATRLRYETSTAAPVDDSVHRASSAKVGRLIDRT